MRRRNLLILLFLCFYFLIPYNVYAFETITMEPANNPKTDINQLDYYIDNFNIDSNQIVIEGWALVKNRNNIAGKTAYIGITINGDGVSDALSLSYLNENMEFNAAPDVYKGKNGIELYKSNTGKSYCWVRECKINGGWRSDGYYPEGNNDCNKNYRYKYDGNCLYENMHFRATYDISNGKLERFGENIYFNISVGYSENSSKGDLYSSNYNDRASGENVLKAFDNSFVLRGSEKNADGTNVIITGDRYIGPIIENQKLTKGIEFDKVNKCNNNNCENYSTNINASTSISISNNGNIFRLKKDGGSSIPDPELLLDLRNIDTTSFGTTVQGHVAIKNENFIGGDLNSAYYKIWDKKNNKFVGNIKGNVNFTYYVGYLGRQKEKWQLSTGLYNDIQDAIFNPTTIAKSGLKCFQRICDKNNNDVSHPPKFSFIGECASLNNNFDIDLTDDVIKKIIENNVKEFQIKLFVGHYNMKYKSDDILDAVRGKCESDNEKGKTFRDWILNKNVPSYDSGGYEYMSTLVKYNYYQNNINDYQCGKLGTSDRQCYSSNFIFNYGDRVYTGKIELDSNYVVTFILPDEIIDPIEENDTTDNNIHKNYYCNVNDMFPSITTKTLHRATVTLKANGRGGCSGGTTTISADYKVVQTSKMRFTIDRGPIYSGGGFVYNVNYENTARWYYVGRPGECEKITVEYKSTCPTEDGGTEPCCKSEEVNATEVDYGTGFVTGTCDTANALANAKEWFNKAIYHDRYNSDKVTSGNNKTFLVYNPSNVIKNNSVVSILDSGNDILGNKISNFTLKFDDNANDTNSSKFLFQHNALVWNNGQGVGKWNCENKKNTTVSGGDIQLSSNNDLSWKPGEEFVLQCSYDMPYAGIKRNDANVYYNNDSNYGDEYLDEDRKYFIPLKWPDGYFPLFTSLKQLSTINDVDVSVDYTCNIKTLQMLYDLNNSGFKFIYRPIDLNNPFPGNREPGANWAKWWKDDSNKIRLANSYDFMEYSVFLVPSDITNIKSYNKNKVESDKRLGYNNYSISDNNYRYSHFFTGTYTNKFYRNPSADPYPLGGADR